MSTQRKIQAVLSSAENACFQIVRKELTGKKVEIFEAVNFEIITYASVVKSVDLVKIDGPRHIIVYLTLNRDGENCLVRHQLNCIKVLSDNHQEPSLSAPL